MKYVTPFEASMNLSVGGFTLHMDLITRSHVTGLFGPSGCGKTSFLEVVCGVRKPSQAKIKLGDHVWQDSSQNIFLPPEKRGVGYVPQNAMLFPHKTVRENLAFGGRRARQSGESYQQLWTNVIELLELGNYLDRSVQMLSGGEKQRVALGRALCSAPKLLLLDEPMAALDQHLRKKILPFLRRVREEFDIPMILVSHDPIEVQALCDDLVVLRKGKIFARGIPQHVLMDPEVFPITSDRGFENILPCKTVSSTQEHTIVALGENGESLQLTIPNTGNGERFASMVGIPSREIIIATEEPKNISARNILPASVREISTLEHSHLVQVELDKNLPLLAVELSSSAVQDLELSIGKKVFLILKSMACNLYEDHHHHAAAQTSRASSSDQNLLLNIKNEAQNKQTDAQT